MTNVPPLSSNGASSQTGGRRIYNRMADQLFLSLWYPNFRSGSLAPAILGVLRQFAAIGATAESSSSDGQTLPAPLIQAATVYPIDWSETPVYNRVYDLARPRADTAAERRAAEPVEAVPAAMEQLHDDFCYEFEIDWLLWQPETVGGLDPIWRQSPARVRVAGFGPAFDQESYETNGQIRIAFGTDTPFLQEEVELDNDAAAHVRDNIARLVALVHSIEKNCGISSRLLWSESGESLAEKLIARLQQVH